MSIRLAVLALAGALGGCGLVDPDITHFELYIKDKQFTVDTAQWELQDVGMFTDIDCSGNAGLCATAAQQACTSGRRPRAAGGRRDDRACRWSIVDLRAAAA